MRVSPRHLRALVCGVALAPMLACGARTETATSELEVFNAAALGPPFHDALEAFRAQQPGVRPAQHNAPSLEVVRMVTELGRVPDILAVADHALLDSLIVPAHADWYALLGTNALVLAYGPKSRFRDEITTDNWWQVLLREGVEVGRSDMRVDPSGYRADMAMQLAERFYQRPGLTAQLRATIPERNVRRAEADLSAHLETGQLDYGWTYESLARAHGLKYVKLPSAIDQSDPAQEASYREAKVTLPAAQGRPAITLTGAPIVFALTVPREAPHAEQARRFAAFLLSEEGRAVLRKSGFAPLEPPVYRGTPPAGLAK